MMAGWWTDSHNHCSTIQFHDLTEKFHREAFLWSCMRLNVDAFCASISIGCQLGLNPCPNFFIWREKWRQDSGWKVEIKLTATPGPEPASHPRSSNIIFLATENFVRLGIQSLMLPNQRLEPPSYSQWDQRWKGTLASWHPELSGA